MAHTKTKSRLPVLAYLLPVALLAFVGVGAMAYDRITDRFDTGAMKAKAEAAKVAAAAAEPLILPEVLPEPSGSAAVDVLPVEPMAQAQADQVGCIASGSRCACYDQGGKPVEPDVGLCAGLMGGTGSALSLIPEPPSRDVALHDGAVIAAMRAR